MWKFNLITGMALVAAVVILLVPMMPATRIFLLLGDGLVWVAITAAGVTRISSQMFVQALCKGDSDSRSVALTFDDGPDPVHSPAILKILEQYQCQAAFFVTGSKAETHSSLVREMATAGHTLGNHSYSHRNFFPLYRASRISREISKTNHVLEKITGQPVKYFRPPFGITNPNVSRGLKDLNMKVAGWSIRSLDTRNENPEKVVRRIARKLRGGDVVLLHETSLHIVTILEQLLPLIRERGLACVDLDRILLRENSDKIEYPGNSSPPGFPEVHSRVGDG